MLLFKNGCLRPEGYPAQKRSARPNPARHSNKDDAFKTHPMNFLSEKTLKGAFFGNYKPRTGLPNVVEMYMRKELEVEKFITHEVCLSEINKAFEYMLQGESLRCIIRMDA